MVSRPPNINTSYWFQPWFHFVRDSRISQPSTLMCVPPNREKVSHWGRGLDSTTLFAHMIGKRGSWAAALCFEPAVVCLLLLNPEFWLAFKCGHVVESPGELALALKPASTTCVSDPVSQLVLLAHIWVTQM